MNKILIVEDEKIIRQGLYAMVMRSSVNVKEYEHTAKIGKD